MNNTSLSPQSSVPTSITTDLTHSTHSEAHDQHHSSDNAEPTSNMVVCPQGLSDNASNRSSVSPSSQYGLSTPPSSTSGSSGLRTPTSSLLHQADVDSARPCPTPIELKDQPPLSIFCNPKHDQLQSKLFLMAGEIRTKILRFLLRTDEIVDLVTFDEQQKQQHQSASKAEYTKEILSLSSQIMAVCQKLNSEAAHILYTENVVCLYSRSCLGNANAIFAVMNADFQLAPTHVIDPSIPFSIKSVQMWQADGSDTYLSEGTAKVSLFEMTMTRFKKWKLVVDGERWFYNNTLFAVTRTLASLCEGKEVQLFLGPSLTPILGEYYKDVLLQCQGFQCQKLTVANKCSFLELDTEVQKRVVTAIAAKASVDDLYHHFLAFSNEVYHGLPDQAVVHDFQTENLALIQETSALVSRYERPERVRENIRELAVKVVKTLDDWIIRREDAVKAAHQRYLQAIVELDNTKKAKPTLADGLKNFHLEV